ncbi:MAG: TlpA family protein disulfide reductase [Anaerolineales bacterium]|nr:TlpA family protein disulfide reductase [Anaerolineales bacterium]
MPTPNYGPRRAGPVAGWARLLAVFGVSVVAVGLVAVALIALQRRAAAPPPTPRPQVTAPAATPPQPVPTETPPLPTAAVPATDVVAIVNGRVIARARLEAVQAADRTMLTLLGLAQDPNAALLDRLVNGELAEQAAAAAGFALPAGQAETSLQAFLTERGKTEAELNTALAAQGLTPAAFADYWQRLLLADAFTRQAAQQQGLAVADFLRQLQRQARISFGPAAILAVPTEAPAPVSTPAPAVTVPPDAPRDVNPGSYAPLFDLPALQWPARDFATNNDLLGRPAVVMFFATWCPYCRAQTPAMVAAAQDPAYGDLQFLGIDVGESQATVEAYIAEMGIPYPVLMDTASDTAGQYQVAGFPTTYFLDAQGRIVARHIGQLQPEVLAEYLIKLQLSTGN